MVDNGSSNVSHVDEGTMHAWLDGALSTAESKAVAEHVATCETCAAAAAEARGLIAASTRILSALDNVAGDVVPATARPVPVALRTESFRHARSTRTVRNYASVASVAAVVAVAVGLTLVARERSTPVAPRAVHQMPAVTARTTDARTSAGATPQQPETSVAVASGAPAHAGHTEARKPRASSSPALEAPTAETIVQGAAAGVAAAPSTDSLTAADRMTAKVAANESTRPMQGFAKSTPEIAGARVVASTVNDAGASRIRRTTFQLDSGATVTLVEIRSIGLVPGAENRSDTSVRADTHPHVAQLMLRAPARAATPSVSWISADGTLMILTGTLPLKELEELKKRIVP